LRLKCTKFDIRWGCAKTPLGKLTVLPRPLAVFKGPTSKGRKGKEGVRGRGRGGKGEWKGRGGRERRGRGGNGRGQAPDILA